MKVSVHAPKFSRIELAVSAPTAAGNAEQHTPGYRRYPRQLALSTVERVKWTTAESGERSPLQSCSVVEVRTYVWYVVQKSEDQVES